MLCSLPDHSHASTDSSERAGDFAVDASPPASNRIPRVVWLIAALALGLRLWVLFASNFTNEDFLITLRYVENLARGEGFVYNAGERVLGTTTPLYALLLAGAARLGLTPTVLGKTLNIGADGLLCVVVFAWLRHIRQERAGLIAALLIAVSPIHIRWSISGMETSLVTLAGAAACLAAMERRYVRAYVLLAILFLLRWDSLLLGGVLTAAILWRERRIPWREIGLFLLLVSPWLLFATAYFGSPIPVTGPAKMTVYGWRAHHVLVPQLHNFLFRFFGTGPACMITVAALFGLYRVWRLRAGSMVPLLAWFLLYCAALLLSRVLLFEWYLVPPLPVLEALAALGITAVWRERSLSIRGARIRGVAIGALAVVVSATSGWLTSQACAESQAIENNLRRPIGLWLRDHAAPGERVMLEPIGYIGYYSRLRVLDTVGLVTPEVLPFYSDDHTAPMLDIARHFRPEWALLRPGELKHVQEVARVMGEPWENDYALVKTFAYTPRPDRELIVFYLYRRR